MTEVIKMQSPAVGHGKDPNDTRDDPKYRRYLETEVVGKERAEANIHNNDRGQQEVVDLHAYRASAKLGKTIPAREWIWDKWASAGVVTGLSGAPGAGKSLFAQQMCTHAAAGIKLVGDAVANVPALHITCEDDEDELDRRQISICEAMQIPLPDDLHLMPWVGEETLLVRQESSIFTRTERFKTLDEYIGDHGIKMVTLDLIPDFWNGNEIIRTQVNAFVKSHLAYLAQRHHAAIVPLFHPSQSGVKDGTGQSGSTAWEGSFRGRIYLKRKDPEDHANPDRIISRVKANYAALDEKELMWREGYLWERGTDKQEERLAKDVGIFNEILVHCEKLEIAVSAAANSKHYYGKLFPDVWKSMDARRAPITKRAMERAYVKALVDGAICEVKRTNSTGKRIKFVGYGEA